MLKQQEDLVAESILKKVEIAKITRQLKNRLSKTNLNKLNKSNNTNNNNNSNISKLSTTNKLNTKRSIDSINSNHSSQNSIIQFDNKTYNQLDESPLKKQQFPPSSPIYQPNDDDSNNAITNDQQQFTIPKTPPQQKIHLNTDLLLSSISTNKTQININSSSPMIKPQINNVNTNTNLLSTPKRSIITSDLNDEGADLLMFLATSPSPIQYSKTPSTPSTKSKLTNGNIGNNNNNSSNNSKINLIHNQPSTPMRNLLKTPGFNMNDYVNLFTPSPSQHFTQQQQQQQQQQLLLQKQQNGKSQDINGKLIKF
ncbi:hypothetical protein WICMUC_000211 [Wickerhamomyces mucosus]|uniref:Uncharacterized protein n=1 Tax=Wickerhamomyces mucosus TaxID=1378264 RepID=A0A9P8Q0N0_9ASCO|nr:hypothetical protein WICMUC_000211 [Wickerhamomyces mucosus]